MNQNGGTGGAGGWDAAEDSGVLDTSETLDDDRVADPLDTGVAAPDRWSAANRFGTTPAEARAGEPLGQLLAEEEPDVDPYADVVDDDDELMRRGYEREARAGRIVAGDRDSGGGFDGGGHADAVAWDAGVDGGGASAEEAAVHVVDEPDGPGDGPLH
jgi:hypothetical protein